MRHFLSCAGGRHLVEFPGKGFARVGSVRGTPNEPEINAAVNAIFARLGTTLEMVI
jgi:hypothetical protein